MNNPVELSQQVIDAAVKAALVEDLGDVGDITCKALIPEGLQSTASIVARADGVLSGLPCALTALRMVDDTLKVTCHKKDGDVLNVGDVIATLQGNSRSILTAERTALNFLTHLSGISTLTARFVKEVAGTKAKILCTRKTHAGLRALEKYAVRLGGAINHRFGLYDAVLIKDNHLAVVGSIRAAVEKARAAVGKTIKVEIEVDSLLQLREALATDADIIMLDNFNINDLRQAVVTTRGRVPLEASGGINLQTVRSVAETNVNYISVGAITHSAQALDIALDF
ncbi:MAG: carboxylating nicotinate-nucleotide diphosphorylase [Alphaproteobacteria bacterium]|nr:carboxylating nicotinate-nucleotide diphosphorylase [Alphaproteobacteria bacterium]